MTDREFCTSVNEYVRELIHAGEPGRATLVDMSDSERYPAAFVDDEREAKRQELVDEARRGAGAFWPTGTWSKASDAPKFDGDQTCEIVVAVRDAIGAIGLTAAERYELILTRVMSAVESYADVTVDE